MNKFNPKKLLNSKWTAITPIKKQKHFIVTDIEFDEFGAVIDCIVEAVISNNSHSIDWQDLKNDKQWRQGWK